MSLRLDVAGRENWRALRARPPVQELEQRGRVRVRAADERWKDDAWNARARRVNTIATRMVSRAEVSDSTAATGLVSRIFGDGVTQAPRRVLQGNTPWRARRRAGGGDGDSRAARGRPKRLIFEAGAREPAGRDTRNPIDYNAMAADALLRLSRSAPRGWLRDGAARAALVRRRYAPWASSRRPTPTRSGTRLRAALDHRRLSSRRYHAKP